MFNFGSDQNSCQQQDIGNTKTPRTNLLLSFDRAPKNLAYCVFDMDSSTIVELKLVDLKSIVRYRIYLNVTSCAEAVHMLLNDSIFKAFGRSNFRSATIERQLTFSGPRTGLVCVRNCSVQAALHASLISAGIQVKSADFLSVAISRMGLPSVPVKREERKEVSMQYINAVVRGDELPGIPTIAGDQVDYVKGLRKKDDIADAVLLVLLLNESFIPRVYSTFNLSNTITDLVNDDADSAPIVIDLTDE